MNQNLPYGQHIGAVTQRIAIRSVISICSSCHSAAYRVTGLCKTNRFRREGTGSASFPPRSLPPHLTKQLMYNQRKLQLYNGRCKEDFRSVIEVWEDAEQIEDEDSM